MAGSLYIVDAFTNEPFRGNPAAVCSLHHEIDAVLMQSIAAEMNLSETAFVVPTTEPDIFGLRWFTPLAEVALCGHATLASAHVLWSYGLVPDGKKITFQTLSGDLTATPIEDSKIALDFPAKECHDFAPPLELLLALHVQPKTVQRNKMDILIELGSEDEVLTAAPDFALLREVKDVRGVIITAQARDYSGSYDFVTRFFAPAVGIDEDPVTGSAHCALAPFWSKRLGKTNMIGLQASKRGGFVGVRIEQDRVILIGKAVTMLEGKLLAI